MEEKIIGTKYRLLKKIGEGGSGTVYLAEDIKLKRLWAVKEVTKELQFEQEVETLRLVQHKNLPLLVDMIKEGKKAYLVLEYIEGNTLLKLLKEKKTLPLKESIEIGMEILEALKCLHQKNPPIVYGDLKPSNVMIDREGNVKLIDFGTAFLKDSSKEAYGTPGYAAPEQILKHIYSPGIDGRADIYSFGILLYQMITGEIPMDKEGMKEMNHPYLRDTLKKIILKCTAFEKENRYDRVDELLEELKKLSFLEKRRIRRKRAKTVLFCLLFFLSILLFVFHCMGFGQLLYPAFVFWLFSFLWYKAFVKKREEFYKGDGMRLLLTSKNIPGLLLLILFLTCFMVFQDNLLFADGSQAEAADEREEKQVPRDEFGRKILIRNETYIDTE